MPAGPSLPAGRLLFRKFHDEKVQRKHFKHPRYRRLGDASHADVPTLPSRLFRQRGREFSGCKKIWGGKLPVESYVFRGDHDLG